MAKWHNYGKFMKDRWGENYILLECTECHKTSVTEEQNPLEYCPHCGVKNG